MGLSCGPRGSLPWSHALKTLTLAVCLGVCILRASAQGAGAEVIDAAVGRAATIPAPVTADILTFAWYRGTTVVDPQLIFTYFVSSSKQVNGPQYTGRESGRPDGSLQITDLRTNYTGNYTVNVAPNGALPATATRQLRVYEPVSKPTVTFVPSQPVENRGAEITCNNSKAATEILWSFNNSPALPGNIIKSPDNRTLTISNVSRGDSGTYQCTARNPVSSNKSDPQTLTVAYGPENVRIEGPGSHSVQNGTKLSLSCTAGSVPEPQYQWFRNDTDLMTPGNTYTVEKVSSRDNGNYTCVVQNNATGLAVQASFYIVVTDLPPNPPNKGLTDGAIAGIVIAVLVVVAGVAALVYVFVFKKPASGAAAARNSTEMASNNKEGAASPKANGTPAEIEYSSVNFVPKRGTPAKPTSPENTVYSEVKRQ